MIKLFPVLFLMLSVLGCSAMTKVPPSEESLHRDRMEGMALTALRQLETAYEKENLSAFLDNVSDRLLPRKVSALKTDLQNRFATVGEIEIKLIVNNIEGHVALNRTAIETQWKRRFLAHGASDFTRDAGATTFIFEIKKDQAELLDFKGDALFE